MPDLVDISMGHAAGDGQLEELFFMNSNSIYSPKGMPTSLKTLAVWAVLLAATACDHQAPDNDFLFPGLPAPDTRLQHLDQAHQLTLERQFGTADGPISFAAISSLTASDGGILAVADPLLCQITLIDLRSERLVDRLGRCGGGPGEFKHLRLIAFRGDSILAFDASKSSLQVLGMNGAHLRTIQLDLSSEGAVSIGEIASLNDTTIILSFVLMPARASRMIEPPIDPRFIAAVDSRSGQILWRFLSDVPFSAKNGQMFLRRKDICLGNDGNRDVVAVINDWAFEGAIVPIGENTPLVHFATNVVFEPYQDKYGEWNPGGWYSSVACGDRAVMFKQSRLDRNGVGKPAPAEAVVELRSYGGALLMRDTIGPDERGLLGRAMAAQGDNFFLAGTSLEGVPVVFQYRFTADRL